MNILGFPQQLGRVPQLPITVLLVAALLLWSGQPDLLNATLTAQTGGTIFGNPALTFVIGVASSRSEDNTGVAALAGAVGYFVLIKAMITISPETNMDVLAGIITDLVGGAAYNRWSGIKLPDFLNFFGDKRFVSVVTGFFCLVLAATLGYVWPPVRHTIHAGGGWIVSAGMLGSGIFGFTGRLLIPTGLHQVLSTIAWFQIGEFTNVAGTVFYDDVNRFYADDGIVGVFMSGFLPIMMFGLSGAALAMYFIVPRECRPTVGGMLLSITVAAFLTGMTESLEFLFMFPISLLYPLYALLTDIDLLVTTLLGIHVGFFFFAGVIGYALMYSLPAIGRNVQILLVMGVVFFAIYFTVSNLVVRMFNLKTPGHEDKEDEIATEEANSNIKEGLNQLATSYIATVGGTDNPKAIDACIIRLRLIMADSARVSGTVYRRLGASGVVKPNRQTIQVVVGAKAESTNDAMKKVVAYGPIVTASVEATPATAAPVAKPQAVPDMVLIAELVSPITGDVVALDRVPDETFVSKAVGDDVVVKPTDKIVASPAVGTIVKIFNANHAPCLETGKGAEIVVRMGIDTVALEGKGFGRLVEEDAQIGVGQPILGMDLDYPNANTRSMTSSVVCSNIDDFSGLIVKAQGHVVVGQTLLCEIKE